MDPFLVVLMLGMHFFGVCRANLEETFCPSSHRSFFHSSLPTPLNSQKPLLKFQKATVVSLFRLQSPTPSYGNKP